MNNQEIVAKLWNLCNVLRDDGITYHQYVTELTYLLFLKMCKEAGREEQIPAEYRWDSLTSKDGIKLKEHYKKLLETLFSQTATTSPVFTRKLGTLTRLPLTVKWPWLTI